MFGFSLFLSFSSSFLSCMAKDSPNQPEPKNLTEYLSVFRHADTWWFSLFYAITFGGFSGLASYLGIFFYDIYGDKAMSGGLIMVQIGYLVTITVIAGSISTNWRLYCRPHWRNEILQILFACISICAFLVTPMPSSFLVMLLITSTMMACLAWGTVPSSNCATTFQRRNWSDDRDCWCVRRFRGIPAPKLYIRTAEASYW